MTSPKQETHIDKLLQAAQWFGLQITIKPAEEEIFTDYRRHRWYSYTVNVKARP